MVEKLPPSLEPAAPRLVLVVDDEPRMIRFIRMNLELEGYQVIEARNGLQALDQIRQHLPDLVIMDVMMPEMDGFEALRLLREISTVPVILLTVRQDEEDKIRGLELGADDYVTKPFSPRELNSRVNAVLRRAEWPAPAPRTILRIDDRL
ncbi:MAG: response regulator, partial [Chloroflexota bacterium]